MNHRAPTRCSRLRHYPGQKSSHRAITFTSYFRRKYLVSLDSLNLIFKNVFGEYVSNISRKKENTRAKIFEISALKYRYERDPRLFFPPFFSREKLESFRRDPFNDFAISLDENEGRGLPPTSIVVAFRENRARKVRDKSSYVSSGIRLRLCVGRCQIQIVLRWRHFGENKKSSNSRSGRDRSNFSQNPKISPLSTFPLPLGKLISNQLFRDPHSSSIPSVPSPVPSHAREVLTWQNVIFEELRSTLRTSRRPAS